MSFAERVVMLHAGGWDEMLIAAGPLIVIGALIYIARKKVPVDDEESEVDGTPEA